MLRMRRPGRYHRATRFCGQASPPTSRIRTSGTSRSMVASRVGQQAIAVTGVRTESLQFLAHQGRAGRARHERRAGHQRYPDLLDGEIERDRHALVDAIAWRISIKLAATRTKLQMLACPIQTPFGLPVVPDV